MSIKISRRLFFPVALGFALTAGGSTPRRSGATVDSIFTEIQSDISDAESAVRHFVQTDFIGLLSVYNDFYPIIRDGQGFQAIHALKNVISNIGPSYTTNTRRLHSMPALMAIHLLSKTINRDPLEAEILSTLQTHPHTREIILQNLITATLPSSDTITNIPVTYPIISSVRSALLSSIRNAQFFQDACPSLQYLLNIRSLLVSYDHANPILDHINTILRSIEISRSPLTRELKLMIPEHASLFSHPVFSDPLSLSPQITEVIYGLHSLPTSWRRYAEIMVLLNARMFHNHFTVWKSHRSYSGLTFAQAKESVAKSVRFWRERGLYTVLERAGLTEEYATREDQHFQTFLRRDLAHILSNAEKEGLDVVTLAGGDGYASPVSADTFPLVRYRLDSRFASEAKKMDVDDRTWLGECLTASRDLSIGVMAGAIIEIIKWRLDRVRHITDHDDRSNVETKVEQYSANTAVGLQNQQDEIGSIEVDIDDSRKAT